MIRVSDEAFSYLVHQRGALWNLRDDRGAWETAYASDLGDTFQRIKRYLPEVEQPFILDVGSGMGGIAALLKSRYPDAQFCLMDALDRGAAMVRHGEPYGSTMAAMRFLADNGVTDTRALTEPPGVPVANLVLSFQAWGFHFPPAQYLDAVRASLAPGAKLILDVRRTHTDWRLDFVGAFGRWKVIARLPKSDLLYFEAP